MTQSHTPTPHPSKWSIIPRRPCDIGGAGASKRYCFCVYADGKYVRRFYRRRDAAAFISEQCAPWQRERDAKARAALAAAEKDQS